MEKHIFKSTKWKKKEENIDIDETEIEEEVQKIAANDNIDDHDNLVDLILRISLGFNNIFS